MNENNPMSEAMRRMCPPMCAGSLSVLALSSKRGDLFGRPSSERAEGCFAPQLH